MVSMLAARTELQRHLTGAADVSAESRRFILLDHVVVTLTGSVTTYSKLEVIIDGAHVGRMNGFDRIRWARKESSI